MADKNNKGQVVKNELITSAVKNAAENATTVLETIEQAGDLTRQQTVAAVKKVWMNVVKGKPNESTNAFNALLKLAKLEIDAKKKPAGVIVGGNHLHVEGGQGAPQPEEIPANESVEDTIKRLQREGKVKITN